MEIIQHGFIVVDVSRGNDAIAQRESWSNPCATVSRAFGFVRDYDTILIYPGLYSEKPQEPTVISNQPGGGAALWLRGRRGVTIQGIGLPEIQFTGHGNGLTIENGIDVTVEGLQFRGAGLITEPKAYTFALVLLNGVNESIRIQNCVFTESGNHGIAHLLGPRTTNNSIFENNRFLIGGNMNHPILGLDGAAISLGGSGNLIRGNQIERWVRGIEFETGSFPESDTPTSRNVCAHNKVLQCWWQHIAILPTYGQAALLDQILVQSNIIQGWGTQPQQGFNPKNAFAHEGVYFGGGMNVQIRGNDISDMWGGAGLRMNADWSDIEDALVSENRIWNVGSTGIQARGPSAGSPTDLAIGRVPLAQLKVSSSKSPGAVAVLVSGPNGQIVRVQRRATVTSGWSDWQSATIGETPSVFTDSSEPNANQAFYRAVMEGPDPPFAVRRCRLIKNKIGPCGGRGIWIDGDYNVVESNDVHLCNSGQLCEGLHVGGLRNTVRQNRLIDCLELEDMGTETQAEDNDVFWESMVPPSEFKKDGLTSLK